MMVTETKDEKHGQIFFTIEGDYKGEIILTHEQGEKFINLVVETNVFSDANIKEFLGFGDEVKLTVSGWTFGTKRKK